MGLGTPIMLTERTATMRRGLLVAVGVHACAGVFVNFCSVFCARRLRPLAGGRLGARAARSGNHDHPRILIVRPSFLELFIRGSVRRLSFPTPMVYAWRRHAFALALSGGGLGARAARS